MRHLAIAGFLFAALLGYSALSAARPTSKGTYRTKGAAKDLPPTELASFAAG